VEKQLASGDPRVTLETFERLQKAGYSDAEAKAMISRALVVEAHTILSEGQCFDVKRFARALAQLPALPEDHWD